MDQLISDLAEVKAIPALLRIPGASLLTYTPAVVPEIAVKYSDDNPNLLTDIIRVISDIFDTEMVMLAFSNLKLVFIDFHSRAELVHVHIMGCLHEMLQRRTKPLRFAFQVREDVPFIVTTEECQKSIMERVIDVCGPSDPSELLRMALGGWTLRFPAGLDSRAFLSNGHVVTRWGTGCPCSRSECLELAAAFIQDRTLRRLKGLMDYYPRCLVGKGGELIGFVKDTQGICAESQPLLYGQVLTALAQKYIKPMGRPEDLAWLFGTRARQAVEFINSLPTLTPDYSHLQFAQDLAHAALKDAVYSVCPYAQLEHFEEGWKPPLVTGEGGFVAYGHPAEPACCICLEELAPGQTSTLRCGHRVACVSCATKLDKCPICRTFV